MTQVTTAETAIPGLLATTPEPLPFAPALTVRAFLLQREHGNVLLHSTTGLAADADAIDDLGGVSRQYLGHSHEAMFISDWAPAPLFVHTSERAAVERRRHVRGTFSRRHMLDDDLEVIPIPGHTPGSTAFLWDTGEHRLLFTADTIYLSDGEWTAAVLDSSDPEAYSDSLDLIETLAFDVLVPWAASAGRPFHAPTDPADTRRRIDRIRHGTLGG